MRDARVEIVEKFGEGEMELQRLPETLARFLVGLCANQKIQRVVVFGQQARDEVAAQIAGAAGYEDRHNGSDGGAELGTAGRARGLRGPIELAGRARFERASLHQRIAPAAQRRNVNVNPVVPPVNRFGVEFE